MKNTLTTTLIAIAGAALFGTSGQAQQTPIASYTNSNSEFILGARLNGSITSVFIDIGQISDLTTTQTFNLQNFGSLLSSTFGANWATNSNVFFSLVAASSGPTTWVTSPEVVGGSEAVLWPGQGTALQTNSWKNQINNMGTALNSYSSQQSVGNLAVVEAATDPNAYAQFMPGGSNDVGHAGAANIAFGRFNPTTEGNFANGVSGITLDLIQLTTGNNPGTDVGDFTINGTGSLLTFKPDALETIPEPSPYALVAVGAATLAILGLRKSRKQAESRG